jgi:hypothetical protein
MLSRSILCGTADLQSRASPFGAALFLCRKAPARSGAGLFCVYLRFVQDKH